MAQNTQVARSKASSRSNSRGLAMRPDIELMDRHVNYAFAAFAVFRFKPSPALYCGPNKELPG